MNTEKKCRMCGEELLLNMFYQLPNKECKKGYTLSSYCKLCTGKRQSADRNSSFKRRFTQTLGSARVWSKLKNRECTITVEYLLEQFANQGGKCYYTGVELKLGNGVDAISMDRVDPSKGYVPGNVVLTTWRVNNLKRDLSYGEFIRLCGTIFEYSLDYRESLL